MRDRKLFTRRDLFLLGVLAVLCAGLFLFFYGFPQGTEAVVEREGKIVLRQELSQLDAPREVTVQGAEGHSLTVTLYPDGAAVTKADCPDRTCVRTGKLERAGETAVCLPAQVSVRLEGGFGADAQTY